MNVGRLVHSRSVVRAFLLGITAITVTACAAATGSGPRPGQGGGPGVGRPGSTFGRPVGAINTDVSDLYTRYGLMAASAPVPFVGRIAFFASSSPDSSMAMISLSLPTTGLTFIREGERYRAGYSVVADMRPLSGGGNRRVVEANEAVRVISVQETQRNEEAVIFQKFFNLTPGDYRISLVVRDNSSGKASNYEGDLSVPDVRARGISTAVMVHEAEVRTNLPSLPKLVASPRSTGIFGRDTVLFAYVESYGSNRNRLLRYDVVNEVGTTLAIDSIQLNGSGGELSGAVVRIPVTTVGLGVGRLRLWFPGTRDTVSGPLFVGFGEDLPVATFNDMLNYLRFYINPARILTLRQAAEDQRAALWSAFLRDTDPSPSTPQHEGLLAYFDRIRRANDRFRGEATDGWLTDRGRVYVTLGEPDQLTSNNSGEVYGRNRTFAWDYQRYNIRLFFTDRTGLGRWTLDPSSEADFNSVAARERVGQ